MNNHDEALKIIYGNAKVRAFLESLIQKYTKDFIENDDEKKFFALRAKIQVIQDILQKAGSHYKGQGEMGKTIEL